MPIAAITSNLVSAARAGAASAPVESVQRVRVAQRQEGGHRHELVDAIIHVLGIDGEDSATQAQAVYRFGHALMHELRTIDTGGTSGSESGRGHAWERRDWNDLPQRLDALATATATPADAAQPTAPALNPAPPAPATDALSREALPRPTNPVTTTSAAVELMQVPSSRLLEAYAALRAVLDEQGAAPLAGALRGDLAIFIDRLSKRLTPDAPATLPAGSVMHLTA